MGAAGAEAAVVVVANFHRKGKPTYDCEVVGWRRKRCCFVKGIPLGCKYIACDVRETNPPVDCQALRQDSYDCCDSTYPWKPGDLGNLVCYSNVEYAFKQCMTTGVWPPSYLPCTGWP